MSDVANSIEQMRKYCVKPPRDTSIASIVQAISDRARKTNRKLGELIELWEQHVPAEIAARTTIIALRGGTVHVAVDDSSTGYEIDRLLREGLEQSLRSSYRGTLLRVRLRISSEDNLR